MKLLIVLSLVVAVVVADIFETNKAPAFNKDGCEAKCLGLCLTGNQAIFMVWESIYLLTLPSLALA